MTDTSSRLSTYFTRYEKMANDLKNVMIALHPPSLDRCERVVDAMFPPAGSAGHICGCTYPAILFHGGFRGGIAGKDPVADLFDPISPNSVWDPNAPKFSVEAQDWLK